MSLDFEAAEACPLRGMIRQRHWLNDAERAKGLVVSAEQSGGYGVPTDRVAGSSGAAPDPWQGSV